MSKSRGKPSGTCAIVAPAKKGEWIKLLRKHVPEYSGVKLYTLIHDEILVKAQQFTPEKAEDFKKGTELLGDVILAYELFKNEQGSSNRGQFSDMLGEWVEQVEGFNKRSGQFWTPMNVCEFMVKIANSDKPEDLLADPPKLFMDPAAGSGRFMLSTAKHYAETAGCLNFIYYNIDIDQRAFIYCTMNAILNRIPSIHIHGDSLAIKYWEAFAVLPEVGNLRWVSVDAKLLEEQEKEKFRKAAEERRAEAMKPREVETPFGKAVVRPKLDPELQKPKEKKEKPRQVTF